MFFYWSYSFSKGINVSDNSYFSYIMLKYHKRSYDILSISVSMRLVFSMTVDSEEVNIDAFESLSTYRVTFYFSHFITSPISSIITPDVFHEM